MDVRYQSDVMVPMRDGVRLATDIWIPSEQPAPALLVRLPYGKTVLPGLFAYTLTPNAFDLLEQGYAIVWQDCRGTYASEGDFVPMVHEADDGVDTVAWVRGQHWCDGTVGTYGASYLGMTQWMTAGRAPEGLAAVASTVAATDFYAAPWYSPGGAMSWHTVLMWSLGMAIADAQRAVNAGTGTTQVLGQLIDMAADPLPHLSVPAAQQTLLIQQLPWWTDWAAHPDRDDFWRAVSVDDRLQQVQVPALHIGGWFDIFVEETARSFTRLRSHASTPRLRDAQRLIIGPWDHLNHTGMYRDRQFGLMADAALSGLTQAHVNFFDRWVRGTPEAIDNTAPVRIFVMGIDQWRDEPDWPLPDTSYTDYFLDGAGQANTGDGDGRLVAAGPPRLAVDEYVFNPADPVPSVGGRLLAPAILNLAGPADQRSVENRRDVLCYTSDVVQEPIEVTGHVSVVLHVSSSAVDTDFTAKLVDFNPDGRASYLTDGILRMRYRDGLDHPQLMTPGTAHQVTIDLGVTSNVFLPGHRIRLEVSSSNFPRYDRNTNTGGAIAQEDPDRDGLVATNRVLHGPTQLSRLVLPVIHR